MHDMLAHTIIYPPAVWRLCRDLLRNSVWMTLTFQTLVWDGEHFWEPGKIIIFFQSRRQRSKDVGFLDGEWLPPTGAGGQVTHLDIYIMAFRAGKR